MWGRGRSDERIGLSRALEKGAQAVGCLAVSARRPCARERRACVTRKVGWRYAGVALAARGISVSASKQ